jgi:DNA-binding protein H-NS
MATIKELQDQLAELQRQIAETTQREKADAIAAIKKIMDDHGLTVGDLAGSGGKRGRPAGGGGTKGMTVAPKYRDPASGKEWSGRGVAPTWIRDKNRDDYLIKALN